MSYLHLLQQSAKTCSSFVEKEFVIFSNIVIRTSPEQTVCGDIFFPNDLISCSDRISLRYLSPQACQHIFSGPRKGAISSWQHACSMCTARLRAAAIAVRNRLGSQKSFTTDCAHCRRGREVRGPAFNPRTVDSEHLWFPKCQHRWTEPAPRLGGCAAFPRESWAIIPCSQPYFPRL